MLRIDLHTPESLCRKDESTGDHKGVVRIVASSWMTHITVLKAFAYAKVC
jgi:hypothetical protein